MNVWTDGTGTVVLSPVGLSLHVEDDATLLSPGHALGYEKKKSRLEASRLHDREPLTADAEAGFVWLVDFDGRPVAVSFDGGEPIPIDDDILEIAALDETGAVAAVLSVDRGAEVRRGTWDGEEFEWAEAWPLPDEIARVDWPDAIWEDDEVPWSDTERWSGRGEALKIARSPFGVCVADAQTGLLAIKRDPSDEGPFDEVLRFPGQYESTLYGSATDGGAVATLTVEDRDACTLHVSTDGEVRFSDAGWNLSTVTVLDETHALVARDGSKPTVEFWNLETGECDRRLRSSWSSRGRLTLGAGGDEEVSLLAMGLGHTAVVARREEGEWSEFEEVDLPEPETDEEVDDPSMATKIYGDPSFAFVEREEEPEWRFEAGSEFEIVLPVANEGGDGEGIEIEVEGAAIDDGLIEPTSVEIDDRELDLEGGEATFPDRPLKAAREAIDGTVPVETIEVTVRGDAKSEGHGLLMIRVGPKETGRRATVMRGRGVTVE